MNNWYVRGNEIDVIDKFRMQKYDKKQNKIQKMKKYNYIKNSAMKKCKNVSIKEFLKCNNDMQNHNTKENTITLYKNHNNIINKSYKTENMRKQRNPKNYELYTTV